MSGNPSQDGITRDLEAMHRVGLGGFQIFEVGSGIPKGPVAYASPERLQLLVHAAKEAERLRLEFDMMNCPEFQQRRGYDLCKYLPAMTGRVVGRGDISDRFLWDIRRTDADLMDNNYYGRFTELCHQHGLKAYAEPYKRWPIRGDRSWLQRGHAHGGVLGRAR